MKRILNGLGIGQRILLIFAIPMLVIILSLGYRITSGYMNDARNALDARGAHMARQLAALCEFGLYAQDVAELRRQSASVALEEDVLAVQVKDAHDTILVQTGIADLPDAREKIAVFTAPVVRTGVEISDYEPEMTPGNTPDTPHGQVTVYLSTTGMLESLRNTLLSGILLTFSGLLCTTLLAYVVARSVSGPIRHLTSVVQNLTGGDLAARCRETSPGELGSLETGINQMASSLQNAQNKLAREVRDATAALQHTVAELEGRNIELDHARNEAVRAAAARSDFLARMSHEIRTPLSAIIGFNDLLRKTRLAENQQEYTRTISQAADQLLVVIEDILGYTQLESGAVKLELAQFNLHNCLEDVVSMLSATAHQKQLELVLYIHSDVPHTIISDRKRLSQILTNLAANAIKFTEAGHVVVEVALDRPATDTFAIRIDVTDTGIGMTGQQLGQIFEPFVQADVSTSRRFGGTGLGLSISKKLVQQLGGDIRVGSKPGKGSVFSFTLTSPCLAEEPAENTAPLAGRTVIVYDRNPFSLRAVRNRFFTWGAKVYNTSDRDKLRHMLEAPAQERTPCDLLVVGITGAEFRQHTCTGLCEEYATPEPVARLFLVSAELGDPAPDSNCLEHCRILPKPPRNELLLRTVRSLLQIRTPPAQLTEHTPEPQPAAAIRPGLEVLVAEDNHFNQDLISELLGKLGARVTLANNGSEACELASEQRFDLVLMDIHMPVMGGIEATHRLREGINRQTPVIALTADVITGQQEELAREGIDDCLHKPVSVQQLIRILTEWSRPRAGHDRPVHGTATADRSMSPGDAPVFPREFQERLHAELANRLQALQAAWSARDESAMRDQMHQLKGMVDYFSLDTFSQAFRSLQTAIQSQHAVTIETAMHTLQRLLDANEPDT